jgi:predicted RNA binding protein YcfA (HicA-like mRNA interferase family)
VYNTTARLRELEKQLRRLGWSVSREGGKHTIWTDGVNEIAVPRHTEVNEYSARKILKLAKGD